MIQIAALLAVFALFLVATGATAVAADGDVVLAQEETPETTSPLDTEPPPSETTPAEGEEGDGGVPAWGWVLIIGGILVLVLIFIAAVTSSRKKPEVVVVQTTAQPVQAAPPPETAWHHTAREAYGKSRWLFTVMTPEAAVQHGDARFKHEVLQEPLTPEESSGEANWNEMEQTLRQTTFELYGLETNPPYREWGRIGASVAGSFDALKTALYGGASAQVEYRRADTTPDSDREAAYSRRMEAESSVRQARANLEASLNSLRNLI